MLQMNLYKNYLFKFSFYLFKIIILILIYLFNTKSLTKKSLKFVILLWVLKELDIGWEQSW